MAGKWGFQVGRGGRPPSAVQWAVASLALVLAGLFLSALGEAQAGQVRAHAQAQADRDLADAGYPWARLTIDDATAYVVGAAPDGVSRSEVMAMVRIKLAPMMGWPGVFARLEDAMTERAPSVEFPAKADDTTEITGSVVKP